MIFVTIGSYEPFDRLLLAVGRLTVDEELVVQCGRSSVRPGNATCVDFLPFERLVERIRAARVVVTHAGVGSVLCALAEGKRPLVVPRLARFGDAVDDHQLAFARRLDREELVTCVEDPDDLQQAISVARSAPAAVEPARPLALELREYVASVTGRAR